MPESHRISGQSRKAWPQRPSKNAWEASPRGFLFPRGLRKASQNKAVAAPWTDKAALRGVIHSGQRRSRGTWKWGRWRPWNTAQLDPDPPHPGHRVSARLFPLLLSTHWWPSLPSRLRSGSPPWEVFLIALEFMLLPQPADSPVSLWSFASSLVVSTTSPSEKCCTYKNLFLPYVKNRIYLF